MCALKIDYQIQLEAFVQNGCIPVFGLIFIFCRIKLIFGRLTCFGMKRIFLWLSWSICASFCRNDVWFVSTLSSQTKTST